MEKLYQNPFFQVIILFIVSSIAWYFLTDLDKKRRQNVLSLVSDVLYYFVLSTLVLNFLSNPKEILSNPYQIILFSSRTAWLALLFVLLFFFYKYHQRLKSNQVLVEYSLQYFLFLGITNHFFYYFKYQNFRTVLSLVFFFIIYLIHMKVDSHSKNEWTLIALAVFHGIVLTFYSKVIIYYQLVFYRYQIISLLLLLTSLLYIFRSEKLSKLKLLG